MIRYLNSLWIYYGLKTLLLPDDQSELVIRSSEGTAALLFFETILFSKKHDALVWNWSIQRAQIVLGKDKLNIPKDRLDEFDSIWSIKQAFKDQFPKVSESQLEDIRIKVVVAADKQIRIEIQKRLREYSKRFVLDELHGRGNELDFEKHIVMFREYFQIKLDNVNPKNIHIQKSEIVNRFVVQKYGSAEFDFRFMETLYLLWSVNIICIHKLNSDSLLDSGSHEGFIQSEMIDYEANIEIRQFHLLMVDAIRKEYGLGPVSGTNFILPIDQKYNYANGKLTVPFPAGGGATITFRKYSKQIFDAMHDLWINDQKGHYTRKEVEEAYKRVNQDEVISKDLFSSRKAALDKKLKEEDPYFRSKIIFAFDKDSQEWIFKILI